MTRRAGNGSWEFRLRKAAHVWTDTAFRRLGLRLPIVQGHSGGELSAVDLCRAVSEAVDSVRSARTARWRGHRRRRGAARARTARPFNLNLRTPFEDSDSLAADDATFARWLAPLAPYFHELGVALPERPARYSPRYAEQIEAVLEARPAVFSFVFGIPAADVLARCRELDIITLGAATTPAEARALAVAGVDAIVATGLEAGGHRVSFLRTAEQSLTGGLALVPQVADAVDVPVVAAGGIADGRGIAAALTLGADAVQIGTGFLACRESGTHDAHRRALLGPTSEDTGLHARVQWPSRARHSQPLHGRDRRRGDRAVSRTGLAQRPPACRRDRAGAHRSDVAVVRAVGTAVAAGGDRCFSGRGRLPAAPRCRHGCGTEPVPMTAIMGVQIP